MRIAEVRHKGERYWAYREGRKVTFWSSHKWPFYHGSYTGDNKEAIKAFHRWLPFRFMEQI